MIATKKLKKIKKEMISKVDKEKFKTVLAWSTKCENAVVSDEAVNAYLEEWAEAKYEFYIGFGNELKVTQSIDIPITDNEMSNLVNDLKGRYPFHSTILDYFKNADFIENRCPKCETLEKYCADTYKPGMKLSKFLSKYFMDDKFDIEVSKVLQNKSCKGILNISIDPMDFCFMSLNMNRWNSCYNIVGNGYDTYLFAPLSLMRDEHSIVCYRGNTMEYDYNYYGKSIRYISMNNRAMILVDKETDSFITCRAQPCGNDTALTSWSKMVQSMIDKFNGVNDTKWNKCSDYECPAVDEAKWSHLHHDVKSGYYGEKKMPKRIFLGKKTLICPICGKEHQDTVKNICYDCRVKLGVR